MCYYFHDEKAIDTMSQTSSETSQRGAFNPLNPPLVPPPLKYESKKLIPWCVTFPSIAWIDYYAFSWNEKAQPA